MLGVQLDELVEPGINRDARIARQARSVHCIEEVRRSKIFGVQTWNAPPSTRMVPTRLVPAGRSIERIPRWTAPDRFVTDAAETSALICDRLAVSRRAIPPVAGTDHRSSSVTKAIVSPRRLGCRR